MSVTVHPAWKQALLDFKVAGFARGDVISHEWLFNAFRIKQPTAATPWEDAKKAQLKFTAAFEKFRNELQIGELVSLQNIPSVGYRIVPPSEQTRWAFRDGMRDVYKDIRKMTTRIVHIDETALTSDQKKENSDATNRVVTLQSMLSRTRRLPRP